MISNPIIFERDDVNAALQMIRKIAKFFKLSPKGSSILQDHVKVEHGFELSLPLDCRTSIGTEL